MKRFQRFLTVGAIFKARETFGTGKRVGSITALEYIGSSPTGAQNARGIALVIHNEFHIHIDIFHENFNKIEQI